MGEREDDARAFAAVMPGWVFVGRDEEYAPDEFPEFFGQFEWKRSPEEIAAAEDDDEMESLGVPPTDAPISDHLFFVGRVAEALDARGLCIEQKTGKQSWPMKWRVRLDPSRTQPGYADDLSHAALRAATAARRNK